jgi:hypothetical protein
MLNQYLSTVYSEEFYTNEPEDAAEILAADLAGYETWSDDLQARFEAENEAAQTIETEQGALLIPRECVHSDCKSSRCSKGLRIGGFDL